MRRISVGVALVALSLVVPFMTSTAGAGPTPKTTVVLTCDKNADAQISVTLQPSLFDSTIVGSATLDCGPDSISGLTRNRQVVTTTQDAGWVNINTFAVQTAGFNGGCPGASALPAKASCPADGSPGASLVVR